MARSVDEIIAGILRCVPKTEKSTLDVLRGRLFSIALTPELTPYYHAPEAEGNQAHRICKACFETIGPPTTEWKTKIAEFLVGDATENKQKEVS